MGGLGAPDLVPSPTFVMEDIDPAEILEEAKQESDDALATAVRCCRRRAPRRAASC